jgi:hypothetical protein
MIRQAISCDVCGAEKRQTNHWFVAYTQGGELRLTGWNASCRMRAGSKHLCGQTCVHKLVDEFIAGTMASRPQSTPEAADREETVAATDASPVMPVVAARALQVVPSAGFAIAPSRALDQATVSVAVPLAEAPNYGSRRWRAEAWERERERERRASLNTHRKTS